MFIIYGTRYCNKKIYGSILHGVSSAEGITGWKHLPVENGLHFFFFLLFLFHGNRWLIFAPGGKKEW
jgi:hypothetical protein